MRGSYIEPIDEDIKERFLDFIGRGFTRPEAAAAVDRTARQFRALCSPESHNYDPDFAEEYERLTAPDGEQKQGMVERLEEAAVVRAIRSSDRLLEKLLVIHSPDWAVHKPQGMQVNFNSIEQRLQVIFPQLSTETLEQMAREIEERKQLPPGPPDIIV